MWIYLWKNIRLEKLARPNCGKCAKIGRLLRIYPMEGALIPIVYFMAESMYVEINVLLHPHLHQISAPMFFFEPFALNVSFFKNSFAFIF